MYKITIKHGPASLSLDANTIEDAENIFLEQSIYHVKECVRFQDRCSIFLRDEDSNVLKQLDINSM